MQNFSKQENKLDSNQINTKELHFQTLHSDASCTKVMSCCKKKLFEIFQVHSQNECTIYFSFTVTYLMNKLTKTGLMLTLVLDNLVMWTKECGSLLRDL